MFRMLGQGSSGDALTRKHLCGMGLGVMSWALSGTARHQTWDGANGVDSGSMSSGSIRARVVRFGD